MDIDQANKERAKRLAYEASARKQIADKFQTRYREFFFPGDPTTQDELGSRVLLPLNLSLEEVLKIIQGLESNPERIPYADTKDQILATIDPELDRSFVRHFETERVGRIDHIKDPLTVGLSLLRGKDLLIRSATHFMTPLDGVNRAVDQSILLDPSGNLLYGEIWIGYKWKGLDFGTSPLQIAKTEELLPA